MSIESPYVSALRESRLLSSLGGNLLSTDEELLVVPVKLFLDSGAIGVEDDEVALTNAGPYCAFEDLGAGEGSATIRLHIPKTPEDEVRCYLIPPNDAWALSLVTTNAASGYIDLVVADTAAGSLEGFIVLRRRKFDYVPGQSSAGATPPDARGLFLSERVLYPVLATVEDLTLWAFSALLSVYENGFNTGSFRAPSAIHAELDGTAPEFTGAVTVESVSLAPPNVLFGFVPAQTAAAADAFGGERVTRVGDDGYSIIDEDGVEVPDMTGINGRATFFALQSQHGPQPDWKNACQLTGEDIPVRVAGEVGYQMRSAWKRAVLLPFSLTLSALGAITAKTLCPGMSVFSDTSLAGSIDIYIDMGAAPAGAFFAAMAHRATGTHPVYDESELASGRVKFTISCTAFNGVFDGFIFAGLDSER